ncbi:MAG: ABC transporter substrate-binding protein [Xanthobacteraceae bacterium]|nr:ABC transporter substrate-binding protein [Xanthobacteraceae bacterium]
MIRSAHIIAAMLAAVLTASTHVALAQANSPKRINVLTNYVLHGRHAPLFVGVQKGFFRDAGFDVQIAPASGSGFVVSAVEAGRADFGMADAGVVVQAIAKGAKVRAISVFMDTSTAGLASLKPYGSLEALNGASIAASPTDNVRVILPVVFSLKGLDPGTVKWRAADPSVYISLLMSNEVDLFTAAFDGDMPALDRIVATQRKQAHFLPFANFGYDVFGFFIVARAESLQSQAEEVRRFRAAVAKAVQYAIANPEEAAAIMVSRNPTMQRDTVLAQWTRAIKAIDTDYVKASGYGSATTERLQRTIELTKTALKLQTDVKPEDVFFEIGPRK